ncbi:hypothetical protein BaRGS_00005554 [Batillaria attramentaria]|uniref:Uncharacterized protein n=1 Tax=Batillaria attramentaria TaxID=370345 RepID=A0ABD0LW90_9CAEN
MKQARNGEGNDHHVRASKQGPLFRSPVISEMLSIDVTAGANRAASQESLLIDPVYSRGLALHMQRKIPANGPETLYIKPVGRQGKFASLGRDMQQGASKDPRSPTAEQMLDLWCQ